MSFDARSILHKKMIFQLMNVNTEICKLFKSHSTVTDVTLGNKKLTLTNYNK